MGDLKYNINLFIETECMRSPKEEILSPILYEAFKKFYKFDISNQKFTIAILILFPEFGEIKNNKIRTIRKRGGRYFKSINLKSLVVIPYDNPIQKITVLQIPPNSAYENAKESKTILSDGTIKLERSVTQIVPLPLNKIIIDPMYNNKQEIKTILADGTIKSELNITRIKPKIIPQIFEPNKIFVTLEYPYYNEYKKYIVDLEISKLMTGPSVPFGENIIIPSKINSFMGGGFDDVIKIFWHGNVAEILTRHHGWVEIPRNEILPHPQWTQIEPNFLRIC